MIKVHSRFIVSSAIFILLFVIPHKLSAQGKDSSFSRNAIYVEGFGSGLAYSINYEYRITEQIGLRAGFSSWSMTPIFFFSSGKSTFTELPLLVNYLVGRHRDHLELGLGMLVGFSSTEGELFWGNEYSSKGHFILGTAAIGFRMEPKNGGFMFRITFTPFFTFKNVWPFGGISLGYAF
jgi:hypothetical protein